jgi:inosine triphosphate pyrophosphatase
MVLYFITGNNGKFLETQKELKTIEIEQKNIDLAEIQSMDAKEVIEHKLKEASKYINGEYFVEDVCVNIDALNGFPGPLIKWFLKSIGRVGIFEICKSKNNFGATAFCTIGYSNNSKIKFFQGEIQGQVVAPRGESNFGWDPIFVPTGFEKTFAEMTLEEKNKISHRGIAVRKFKEFLEAKL